MERYNIHDNGGRLHYVMVDEEKKVAYHLQNGTNTDPKEYRWNGLRLPYKKIFIDRRNGDGTGIHQSYWFEVGSTILLQVSKKCYFFIQGRKSRFFTTVGDDEIVEYHAQIGNSDVPYPYAVGQSYVYLMIEDVYIEKNRLPPHPDPYGVYYNHRHEYDDLKEHWHPMIL